MISALRELGFDAVFDTNFAADLTIMEEGSELLERLKNALWMAQASMPMFSELLAWLGPFTEYYFPNSFRICPLANRRNRCLALAKTYYAQKIGVKPEDMVVVIRDAMYHEEV